MPNANLRLPSAPPEVFHNDVSAFNGNMSRSQSQNFPYPAGSSGQIAISTLPTSHSVNDNLANTQSSSGQGFGKYDDASKSPKSSRVHSIPHKWESRRCKRIARCVGCARPINFMASCQRCTQCKVRVHTECKNKVGNTCGLTAKHLKACIEHMVTSGTEDDWNYDPGTSLNDLSDGQHSQGGIGEVESSPSNSTNSSTPSTPAAWTMFAASRPSNLNNTLHPGVNEMGPKTAPLVTFDSPDHPAVSLFTFPDSSTLVPEIVLPSSEDGNDERVNADSENTLRTFGSGDESDHNTLINESFDSGTDERGHKWDRRAWSKFTIRDKSSTAPKEDLIIPFDKVTLGRPIGRGRFGEVTACDHFGEAAIKFLNFNHTGNADNHFEAFLREVREVKLARHDRILAFFGCTIDKNTNRMGIVVDYCKGTPLHMILHQQDSRTPRIDFQKTVRLCLQICQGMSYLHNRKLLHKDLRAKNVFITPKNNVVITDYSLFNEKLLCKPNRKYTIITPEHWLCYLAPELLRRLSEDFRELPFSEASDVYAFGTLFYEMLAYDFPFSKTKPEIIVYQVGSGLHPPIGSIKVTREAMVVLVGSWKFRPEDRPTFSELAKMIEKLPMKHLCRSPSNPL